MNNIEVTSLDKLIGKRIYRIEKDHPTCFLVFHTYEGNEVRLYHEQDCCEDVNLEEVIGEYKDIMLKPLTKAEVRTANDPDAGESGTFTFYHFATEKGCVDLRFYGSSNGYYSEEVTVDLWTRERLT